MPEIFDAIVIGAGVVGVSIAFHLAERGQNTVILERRQLASGVTGRSSGQVSELFGERVSSEGRPSLSRSGSAPEGIGHAFGVGCKQSDG